MCESDNIDGGAIKAVERVFNKNRIAFTQDNFLKLAFIYLRVRAGIPFVLMGKRRKFYC